MKSIYLLAAAGADELESTDLTGNEEATNQETTAADGSNGTGEGQAQPRAPQSPMIYAFYAVILVVMYFMFFRGPKKKRQQHDNMVKSLVKNAKIRTIGGIIATVIDVKDDEITIKIDESNNTKMKIIPSAVSTVLSDEKD